MIFAEEDLNSLNAIAGLLASFGCDSQALGLDDVEGWLTARQVTKMWRCRNAAKNR